MDYNGYKARMVSNDEINNTWPIEEANLPTWVYSNMAVNAEMEIIDVYEHVAYWTDSASTRQPSNVWIVSNNGYPGYNPVSDANGNGVRPVVRIMKSNL